MYRKKLKEFQNNFTAEDYERIHQKKMREKKKLEMEGKYVKKSNMAEKHKQMFLKVTSFIIILKNLKKFENYQEEEEKVETRVSFEP